MIYILGLIGMAAFSITGVIAAGKKHMDIFSIVLIGVVTAIGGGTLRDIIIDVPIFWINDHNYLMIPAAAAVLSFFFVHRLTVHLRLLMYIDAFGLSLFTVLATEKTLLAGFSPSVAVLMGLITGVAGGVARDILTNRLPLLLGKEFYATPAFLGAAVFSVLWSNFPLHDFNRIYAVLIVFTLRILAIRWRLYYPIFLTFNGRNE